MVLGNLKIDLLSNYFKIFNSEFLLNFDYIVHILYRNIFNFINFSTIIFNNKLILNYKYTLSI